MNPAIRVHKCVFCLFKLLFSKITFLACIAVLLFSTHLYSQSDIKLQGTVTDTETGMPVQGVNISVQNSGTGTITNRQGHFEIKNLLEGTYSLTFEHIAYEKQTRYDLHVLKDQATQIDIRLVPRILTMPDVNINAEKWTDSPGIDVWTIRIDETTNKTADNAAELIAQVPGIEITDESGSGAKKISIRGSQSNQVLVLLDGVPLNNQSSGDADLSMVPVNMIEKIEIHKGTSASRFGTGALAGAVNIITRKDIQNNLHLEYRTGAWGYNSISPSVSGQIKNWSYLATYQYHSNDGNYPYEYKDSDHQTIKEDRINADIETQNLFLRTGYQIKNHNLALQYQNLDSDRGIPGKIDGWTPYARIQYDQTGWGMDYQWNHQRFNLKIQPRYMETVTENRNLYPDDVELKYKRYPQYHYQYILEQTIVNSEFNTSPFSWLDFTTGHTFRKQQYDNENLMPVLNPIKQQADETANGFFINPQIIIPIRNQINWSLSPSLRYDIRNSTSSGYDDERIDKHWGPAINSRISAGNEKRIYIKSGYARTFRVPTFADLFYQDVRIDGNPDLLPEKSIQTEAGAGFELFTPFSMRMEISTFKNKIDNLIVWRLGSFEVFSPYNTHAEISGTEYLISMDTPNDWFHFNISYSDLDPFNKSDNLTTRDMIIPYRPQNTFKGTLAGHFFNTELGLDYRQVGKRFVNEANTRWLDSYEVWDLNGSITRQVCQTTLILKFSIYNISNTRYETIRDMPMPGREWRLGLVVNY